LPTKKETTMIKKMNPEVKKKWLTALRSGEYEQTQGRLYRSQPTATNSRPAGFCCLGVLCHVAQEEGLVEFEPVQETFDCFENPLDKCGTGLPRVVREWAELTYGDVEYKGEKNSLVGLNDAVGLNFEEIADAIEKSL